MSAATRESRTLGGERPVLWWHHGLGRPHELRRIRPTASAATRQAGTAVRSCPNTSSWRGTGWIRPLSVPGPYVPVSSMGAVYNRGLQPRAATWPSPKAGEAACAQLSRNRRRRPQSLSRRFAALWYPGRRTVLTESRLPPAHRADQTGRPRAKSTEPPIIGLAGSCHAIKVVCTPLEQRCSPVGGRGVGVLVSFRGTRPTPNPEITKLRRAFGSRKDVPL
jgi:hypothetical protein